MTWKRLVAVAAAFGLMLLYRSFLEQGHDWGDDFALYVNQARSLVRGDVPQVVADTRYILQNSGSDTFSPYVYPWGFPLLLAPVYLIAGIDYRAFAWVTVGSFVLFLWAFRRLIAPSIGGFGSYVVASVVALSVSYVRATGAILSDLTAIASIAVTLLWFEHCRSSGHFARSSRVPLVVSGLLVAWAFAVRRETAVLLVALAVVHWTSLRADRTVEHERPRQRRWVDVAAPYWTFAMTTGALHLVLPASLEQQTASGGVREISRNLRWYRDIVAEQIGLKEFGPNDIAWLGSASLGRIILSVVLVLAVFGAGTVLSRRRGPELSIVVYFAALAWVILTQPFRDGRYIFGLTPFVLYFAWMGAAQLTAPFDTTVLGSRWRRSLSAVVPLLVMTPLLMSNADGFQHAWRYHRSYNYVHNGPETVVSKEMLDAVRRCTRGDDVVVFARARAMNLYTNRRTIQTGDVNLALQRGDWMVVSNDSVDYFEPKVNEENYRDYGLAKVWSNTEFTMFRITAPRQGGVDPCPAQAP